MNLNFNSYNKENLQVMYFKQSAIDSAYVYRTKFAPVQNLIFSFITFYKYTLRYFIHFRFILFLFYTGKVILVF